MMSLINEKLLGGDKNLDPLFSHTHIKKEVEKVTIK